MVPTVKVVLSLEVKIDTTKIYTKSLILHKIMSLSRNVNHDKMSAVIRVMRGIQTVMWGRHGLPTIIERPIIGGGLILRWGSIDMIDSVGGRGTKSLRILSLDSTRH